MEKNTRFAKGRELTPFPSHEKIDTWMHSIRGGITLDGEVSLDADWQIGYKRQMEVYHWLFRKNGFKVSNTGYFVYCNGNTDKGAFDGRLEFDVKIIPYEGDTSWVEEAILRASECLNQTTSQLQDPIVISAGTGSR